MAESAKRRETRVLPKLFLAFFPEDKSLCICEKQKVLDETPLRDFLANPIWPSDLNLLLKSWFHFMTAKRKQRQ